MSSTTESRQSAFPIIRWTVYDSVVLVSVLAAALALRWIFFTGFFGSDEVTYVWQADRLVQGDWRVATYIGATRFGMNLPLAVSINWFGLSEFSVNTWPMICSLAEVAIVFLVGRSLWGCRTGFLAATLLAMLPYHVHLAGRILADPPLAFFITLSVALLVPAAREGKPLYLLAGVACGGVFWIKEFVFFLFLPVFFLLAAYCRGLGGRWWWIMPGVGIALMAHLGLMHVLTGDPWHLLHAMRSNMSEYGEAVRETSPWYYFRYLFVDLRHTLLLGYLAAGGLLMIVLAGIREGRIAIPLRFVALWAALLVAMFSFAVVSFVPIKLVSKQTNYMAIFWAPLALLGGWYLGSLRLRVVVPLMAVLASGSVILAALEQQAVTVFTANSKAAYQFLRDRPGTILIGSVNTYRAVNFFSMLEGRREVYSRIYVMQEAYPAPGRFADEFLRQLTGRQLYAVIDPQTNDWGGVKGGIRRLSDVPACWRAEGSLTPAPLGAGSAIVAMLLRLAVSLPPAIGQRMARALQPVSPPDPARLFAIAPNCMGDGVR